MAWHAGEDSLGSLGLTWLGFEQQPPVLPGRDFEGFVIDSIEYSVLAPNFSRARVEKTLVHSAKAIQ